MARPQKQTVDYFPHDADASDGKTLTILFNNFGHEGISCWWQLLERVSRTNNHVISTRNPEDIEFLAAKLHFQPARLVEILDKLAELEAIDPELWKYKVIWIQKLVERLHEVYSSRKQELPKKPDLFNIIGVGMMVKNQETALSVPETALSVPETALSVPENPQTKLNKTKLNKNKENIKESFILPVWIKKETWDAFLEVRKRKKAPNTTHALSLIIKELTTFKEKGDDVEKILENSIMRGYTGVFELNGGKNNGNGHGTLTGESKAFHTPERYTRPEELPT